MIEKRPFFSVLVPAYNSASFIRKGLDSIRDQSFKDYELIIICDKCKDNTADVAREYTDKVKEIDHDVDGVGLNIGLDMASGEWVLFMDDDDWFLHEFAFQTLADTLKSLPADRKVDILAFSFIWKGMGYARNTPQHNYPAPWNKCWRREFIGEDRFPNWAYSIDLGFAMKMHPKAHFAYWDMPLYYYNFMRPGSVSERIKNGEFDNAVVPDVLKNANASYKDLLKDK